MALLSVLGGGGNIASAGNGGNQYTIFIDVNFGNPVQHSIYTEANPSMVALGFYVYIRGVQPVSLLHKIGQHIICLDLLQRHGDLADLILATS